MLSIRTVLAVTLLSLSATAYAGDVPTSTDEARALTAQRSGAPSDATETSKRHAVEMAKGKDHQAAWDATHSSADGERNAARAQRHAEEMAKGKSHEDSRAAAGR